LKQQNGQWSFIFKYAKEKKLFFLFSILLAILKIGFELVPYFLLPSVLDAFISGNREISFYVVRFSIMFGCLVLSLILKALSTSLSHFATFHSLANIRKDMLDKLSKMSLGDIENISIGSLKNIIVERVDSIETTMAHIIPEVTSCLIGALTLVIYLFGFVDYRLGFASLISVGIGFFFLSFMYIGNKESWANCIDKTKILNDTAVDYINGIEVIKIFGKEKDSYEKFKVACHDGAYCFIDWQKRCNLWFAIGLVVAPSVLLGILPIGALMLMDNSITLTTYIIAIITSVAVIAPLITVMSYQDDLAKVGQIVGECKIILANKELVRPETMEKKLSGYNISIKDAKFGYTKEQMVLNGVSLDIKENQFIALVGPSGAGKSTIAKLVASYYDLDSDSVSLGGVDVKEIPLATYNQYISYVGQSNYLFNMSIMENIRLAKPDASDEDIINICKKCGCHDFIMNLENGYQTMVGSKGGHISGGERQRITIARAMLKDAPIVILDEATAYSDPENEIIIEKAISALTKGKTLIVIAHRLSTITSADNIVVVDHGQIVQQGKHEQLLEEDGLYQRMWHSHISFKDEVETC
jgi:ATP-binding cassette subfamily B protein